MYHSIVHPSKKISQQKVPLSLRYMQLMSVLNKYFDYKSSSSILMFTTYTYQLNIP